MDVLFHVEASPVIGHGHVARCGSLADEAERRGLRTAFVPGNDYTRQLLSSLDRPVARPDLETDSAFVVIDLHTAVQPAWVRDLRAAGTCVVLLDCHGPARLEADVVCDAFMVPSASARLPHAESTRYLYGLDYALLRDQFRTAHGVARPGASVPPRLCIVMGGRDQHRVAPRLASALDSAGFCGPASIVAESGAGPSGAGALREITAGWDDTIVSSGVDDMAGLMQDCDLVVNKIGGTTLEAMCLGIGSAMIEPGTAHVDLNAALAAAYPDWPTVEFGLAENTDMNVVASRIIAMLADGVLLRALGQRGRELVDGRGCRRVMDALLAVSHTRVADA